MSRRRKGVSKRVLSAVLSAAMVATTIPAMSITASAESAEGNIELSRQVAADGMVLLENRDEVLPVQQGTTVAMFGRAMIDYTRGGGGSGATNVDYTRNILQGMQIKEEEGKISLYQPLVDFYTEQVTTNGIKNDAQIALRKAATVLRPRATTTSATPRQNSSPAWRKSLTRSSLC